MKKSVEKQNKFRLVRHKRKLVPLTFGAILIVGISTLPIIYSIKNVEERPTIHLKNISQKNDTITKKLGNIKNKEEGDALPKFKRPNLKPNEFYPMKDFWWAVHNTLDHFNRHIKDKVNQIIKKSFKNQYNDQFTSNSNKNVLNELKKLIKEAIVKYFSSEEHAKIHYPDRLNAKIIKWLKEKLNRLQDFISITPYKDQESGKVSIILDFGKMYREEVGGDQRANLGAHDKIEILISGFMIDKQVIAEWLKNISGIEISEILSSSTKSKSPNEVTKKEIYDAIVKLPSYNNLNDKQKSKFSKDDLVLEAKNDNSYIVYVTIPNFEVNKTIKIQLTLPSHIKPTEDDIKTVNKWIGNLKKEIIQNKIPDTLQNKLPYQISKKDILHILKELESFQDLFVIQKTLLLEKDVEIESFDNESGVLNFKIISHGEEKIFSLKFSSFGDFANNLVLKTVALINSELKIQEFDKEKLPSENILDDIKKAIKNKIQNLVDEFDVGNDDSNKTQFKALTAKLISSIKINFDVDDINGELSITLDVSQIKPSENLKSFTIYGFNSYYKKVLKILGGGLKISQEKLNGFLDEDSLIKFNFEFIQNAGSGAGILKEKMHQAVKKIIIDRANNNGEVEDGPFMIWLKERIKKIRLIVDYDKKNSGIVKMIVKWGDIFFSKPTIGEYYFEGFSTHEKAIKRFWEKSLTDDKIQSKLSEETKQKLSHLVGKSDIFNAIRLAIKDLKEFTEPEDSNKFDRNYFWGETWTEFEKKGIELKYNKDGTIEITLINSKKKFTIQVKSSNDIIKKMALEAINATSKEDLEDFFSLSKQASDNENKINNIKENIVSVIKEKIDKTDEVLKKFVEELITIDLIDFVYNDVVGELTINIKRYNFADDLDNSTIVISEFLTDAQVVIGWVQNLKEKDIEKQLTPEVKEKISASVTIGEIFSIITKLKSFDSLSKDQKSLFSKANISLIKKQDGTISIIIDGHGKDKTFTIKVKENPLDAITLVGDSIKKLTPQSIEKFFVKGEQASSNKNQSDEIKSKIIGEIKRLIKVNGQKLGNEVIESANSMIFNELISFKHDDTSGKLEVVIDRNTFGGNKEMILTVTSFVTNDKVIEDWVQDLNGLKVQEALLKTIVDKMPSSISKVEALEILKRLVSFEELTIIQKKLLTEENILLEIDDKSGIIKITIVGHGTDKTITLKTHEEVAKELALNAVKTLNEKLINDFFKKNKLPSHGDNQSDLIKENIIAKIKKTIVSENKELKKDADKLITKGLISFEEDDAIGKLNVILDSTILGGTDKHIITVSEFGTDKEVIEGFKESELKLPVSKKDDISEKISSPEPFEDDNGIFIEFIGWDQSNFSGEIKWEAKVSKGKSEKILTGTIAGFLSNKKEIENWVQSLSSSKVQKELPSITEIMPSLKSIDNTREAFSMLKKLTSFSKLTDVQKNLLTEENILLEIDDKSGIIKITIVGHGTDKTITLKTHEEAAKELALNAVKTLNEKLINDFFQKNKLPSHGDNQSDLIKENIIAKIKKTIVSENKELKKDADKLITKGLISFEEDDAIRKLNVILDSTILGGTDKHIITVSEFATDVFTKILEGIEEVELESKINDEWKFKSNIEITKKFILEKIKSLPSFKNLQEIDKLLTTDNIHIIDSAEKNVIEFSISDAQGKTKSFKIKLSKKQSDTDQTNSPKTNDEEKTNSPKIIDNEADKGGEGLSTTAIVLTIIGSLLSVGAIGFLVYRFKVKKKKSQLT